MEIINKDFRTKKPKKGLITNETVRNVEFLPWKKRDFIDSAYNYTYESESSQYFNSEVERI